MVGLAVAVFGCSASVTDPAAELDAIAEEIWQHALERSPLTRLREGLVVARLADLSLEGARDDAARSGAWLARLEALPAEQLDHAHWVTLEALRWDLGIEVEGLEYYWHEGWLTPYSSPLPSLRQLFSGYVLDSAEAVSGYLDLLAQVPDFVAQIEERARGQLGRGIVVPRANLGAAQALVRAQLRPPAEGPFAVSEERLARLGEADSERLGAGLAQEVEGKINPALEQLAAFLEGEYAAAAPADVGASRYPGGEAYYRFATRRSTTLDVAPEAVHAVGLELVAELEAAMAAIREEVGFTGTRQEFQHLLRSDPRFFPKSPEEVGERLRAAAHAFEARLDAFFDVRPQAPWDARRLDAALEGSQTYGYYDPPTPEEPHGVYYFNGSALDSRSWIGLEAIALHELIPGHHFHIARQRENQTLPKIRRYSMHGAFTEGWGSYASALGLEAGLYQDPYSRYGMYALEVFLASRLVVDPGMNLLGWSLEQGRDYQREHTLESETQIQTESLRYSTDIPATALAYQMGKRKLLELRQRAESALGEDFELRRFHEAVLEHGSLPMAVLERHIDWFIQQEQAQEKVRGGG